MLNQTKSNLYGYLAVYFLLLFKAGFYFVEQSNIITAPLFFLFLLFIATQTNNGGLILDVENIRVSIVLVILICITNIFCGWSTAKEFFNLIINLFTAVFFVSIIPKKLFIKAYCDIIIYISIASTIGWILMTFFPSFFNIFPKLVNTLDRIGYFCGLTIVSDFSDAGMQRTQGIFWEPGAYQCLVVIAMLLEKYYYQTPHRRIRILINSVAIILSFSTTGYIALVLVWMLMLSKDKKGFHIGRIILIAFFAVMLYFVFGSRLSGQLWYTIKFKIEGMLNYKNATNYSITARAGSIIEPLKLFILSPIVGIGEKGYNKIIETVGLATCTPVNYICKYGIVFALINFYGFYKFIKTKGMRLIEMLFIIFTICISFLSETFFMNPILSIFMLYGYKRTAESKKLLSKEGGCLNEYKREYIRI